MNNPDPFDYRIAGIEDVLTPALAIYPEFVEENIHRTLRLLDGDVNRWRPHLKTAKIASVMRQFVENGVTNFKCATSLELLEACRAGAKDVLVAYPLAGANATRVAQIAAAFPQVRVSTLVETPMQIAVWRDSCVTLFIDINPGMNRTGIEQRELGAILELATTIQETGIEFRGLHYYDGHLVCADLLERTETAHRGYDRLCTIATFLRGEGVGVSEVVTSGTDTFPCALSYKRFLSGIFSHRVSAGTLVYCDNSSLRLLPGEYGYRPAALVVTRVVSHPEPGVVTCDAGHKAVSADKGVPTCSVLGQPAWRLLKPSEEHLPIAVPGSLAGPQLGTVLQLVPEHICPTVNNFDFALVIRRGRLTGHITNVEPVSARGREGPLCTATLPNANRGSTSH